MSIPARIVKRLLDIVVALIALILFLPAIIIISILIILDDPGPIMYRQSRIKYDGKGTFRIFKFRSMRVQPPDTEIVIHKSCDDKRITRVGKVIRKYRLDEIPNLFNVLLGDMSIVGPRAEIYHNTEAHFPMAWERIRYNKPGITGLAQLNLKSDGSMCPDHPLYKVLSDTDRDQPVDIIRYKMYYDFAYASKMASAWSVLVTDLKIMFKTPIVMFMKSNVV